MTVSHLELAIRGGRPPEFVDSFTRSFVRALLGSFSGIFRGSWRSSIKWLGIVGRSVGIAILPSGFPAHAGRARALDLDGPPGRIPQDCSDVKEFRGSLHFAQRRISAWEVLVNGSNASIPVGLLARALFRALVSSNDSDPRFISSMLDASQYLGGPESLRGDGNLAFDIKLFAGESQPSGQLPNIAPPGAASNVATALPIVNKSRLSSWVEKEAASSGLKLKSNPPVI